MFVKLAVCSMVRFVIAFTRLEVLTYNTLDIIFVFYTLSITCVIGEYFLGMSPSQAVQFVRTEPVHLAFLHPTED